MDDDDDAVPPVPAIPPVPAVPPLECFVESLEVVGLDVAVDPVVNRFDATSADICDMDCICLANVEART